jgi:hypothetical protein
MPSNGATKIWLAFSTKFTMSLPSRAFSSRNTIRRMIRTWTIPNRNTTTRPATALPDGRAVTLRLVTVVPPST